jgi:hypothetical protein
MGKTITTYLIDGHPQGVQIIFISNKICCLTLIPRSSLEVINKRNELKTPSFYILIGENESQQPQAYIGESESFTGRVKEHELKKPFWQKALVFTSKDMTITKADVQYLEHLAVELAQKAKKFDISENKQIPKAPNLPEHQKSSTEEYFEDVKLLTSFVGCSIFELAEQKGKLIFNLNSKNSQARGYYDEHGFTVLRGSIIAPESVPSYSLKEKRAAMITERTENQDGKLVLQIDTTFSSPSSASDFCIGGSSSGWMMWKDEKGLTLDEVYRKKIE